MKQDPYWFLKKWGIEDDSLASRLDKLEEKIDYLIQENIGTTNTLYEIENKLDMLSSCQYNMLEVDNEFNGIRDTN